MKHYVEQYRSFSENGASRAPAWLKDRRKSGIDDFERQGFPTSRAEEWRFTNIRAIASHEYELSHQPGSVDPAAVSSLTLTDEHHRLVFVDGHFVSDLSDLADIPAAVHAGSLLTMVGSDAELVERHLGRYARSDSNPFTALSTAFIQDGPFVHVPEGIVVREPIELLFISTRDDSMTHPRSLVVLGDNAQAVFVESYVSLDGMRYLTNAVTEIVVGDNAHCEFYRIQREAAAAHHIAAVCSYQGRDSRFAATHLSFGAALARNDLRLTLDGEGGEGTLRGLYVTNGTQHVDFHTIIDHAKPHCQSYEHMNGILDDNSRAVFTGRIIVREGAQKTDSKQSNNNLLLSQSARADSQPQLEIYADDVRCTHGATLGPMSEEAVFYLRSRGVDERGARRLLTYGFASEIISRISVAAARDEIDALVRDSLAVE
ncbi:MAG: Fe-S cluster assembly protein SufD [Gemmatimonadales bacterium]